MLKLDMGFLHESEDDERCKIILGSVIQMAKALGMDVIVEGVETEKQLSNVSAMGCSSFQGYYFSRPVSAEDFEKKYRTGMSL